MKFAADNLEIVEGLAPEALKDLPTPTHAFIGGSSGNLKEIVKLLLEKNPQVRIVINCSTFKGNRTLSYDDGRESYLYYYTSESREITNDADIRDYKLTVKEIQINS